MAAFADFPVIVAGGGLTQSTHGALAGQDFFRTMGVPARIGPYLFAQRSEGGRATYRRYRLRRKTFRTSRRLTPAQYGELVDVPPEAS